MGIFFFFHSLGEFGLRRIPLAPARGARARGVQDARLVVDPHVLACLEAGVVDAAAAVGEGRDGLHAASDAEADE